MPIEFSRSYKASDGKCYASLEQAQIAELDMLVPTFEPNTTVAEGIVANKDAIVSILTLNDSSRPKARGVPKKRRAKTEPAAQPTLLQTA